MLKDQLLNTQTYAAGSTLNIQVLQTGIAALLRLIVQVTATAATASLTPGPKAPFAFLPLIQYTDPSGNTRINSPAWELFLLSLVKKQWDFDPSSGNAGTWPTNIPVANQPFGNPTVTTGGNLVTFWVDLPFMLSPVDTRGGILLESSTSQSFVTVQMQALAQMVSTTANADFAYNSATGTMTSIVGSIYPVYYYYSPNYIDLGNGNKVLPVPYDDLSVIHEIITQRANQNITSNSDVTFTLQTGRSYQRMIGSYVNNAALTDAVTAVRFQYDGSTKTLTESRVAYYARVRDAQSRDLPQGAFWWDWTRRPWDSTHYGQLDVILAPDGSALTNAYMQFMRESIYIAPQA
jgi:hypothetical protein